MKIQGAIFDMDGTLIDSLMLWDVLWDCFGEKYRGESFRPSPEVDKAVRTMLLRDAMDLIHREYGLGESGEELLNEANRRMEAFYEKEVEMKPGARAFLEYCHKSGVKMCIASATERRLLDIAIRHCELEPYLDAVLSCSEIGKGKDQPDIYLRAAEMLGTEIGNTCVFEDSLVAIRTADGIGMQTVAVYDRYNYGQAEMQAIAAEYIAEGETWEKLIRQNWLFNPA